MMTLPFPGTKGESIMITAADTITVDKSYAVTVTATNMADATEKHTATITITVKAAVAD